MLEEIKISASDRDMAALKTLIELLNVNIEIKEDQDILLKDYNVLHTIKIMFDREEIARKRHRYGNKNSGRKKKEIDDTTKQIREKMKTKTAEEVAAEYNISRRTLFRRLKEYEDFE